MERVTSAGRCGASHFTYVVVWTRCDRCERTVLHAPRSEDYGALQQRGELPAESSAAIYYTHVAL